MLAFLSYQHKDRRIAAEVQGVLTELRIQSFMAHEDIDISRQWQREIMSKLRAADIFIALLSEHYLSSAYCVQESGIAVFRERKVTIIPLSLDGTISPGCMAHIQSRRVNRDNLDRNVLYTGLAEHDPEIVIDNLVQRLAASGSFRSAESHFEELQPFLDRATDASKGCGAEGGCR